MDLFSPHNLPGVGMGDLESIAAICGLLGMAVTSGMMIAEGLIGTLVFVISAAAVLQEKDDMGGSVPAAGAILVFLLLVAAARWVLVNRARRESAGLAGAASDAPETKAARRAIVRRERWAQWLAILSVAWAGAAVGFAWAEWNEVPFRLEDGEAWLGLVLGVVGASIGGDAAWRFLQGAIRAGGSSAIVGAVVVLAAFVLNALSVYVPFVGGVVFVLALVLALRLRRRSQQTYQGLRILS
ncbi:MAG: hypothetical protein KDC46_08480 [Thermoleophilia bacterium]|nr:hypothetical protein [Thermoleophilia bacterium]